MKNQLVKLQFRKLCLKTALQISEVSENDSRLRIPGFCNRLLQKFKKYYQPNKYLVIYESMVAFKGKSKMKFYIPQKPKKWGFKLHILSESGYALNMEMDTRNHKTADMDVPFTISLINRLIPENLNHKYHILFTDSWYTSLPLLLLLKKTWNIFNWCNKKR